jgi:hypothetical protein
MLTADGDTSPTVGLTFNYIDAHYIRDAAASSREQRDRVTLYTGLEHAGCSPVYVVTGPPLTPFRIDGPAADPREAPLPDVEVRGNNCEQNKRVMTAAAKKFIR